MEVPLCVPVVYVVVAAVVVPTVAKATTKKTWPTGAAESRNNKNIRCEKAHTYTCVHT